MYYQEVIIMSIKSVIGILTVTILTLFLLTAGISAALSEQGNSIVDDEGVGDIDDPGDHGNGTDDDDGPGDDDGHGDNSDDNETDDDNDDDDSDDGDDSDDNETDDDNDDDDSDDGDDSDDNETDDDNDDDDSDDEEGSIGHFVNGTSGRFVSFDLFQNEIKNYTVKRVNKSINVFDKITINDLIIDDKENKGSYYEIEGDDTEIKVYDVRSGLLKIDSEAEELTNISFELGDFQVDDKNGRNLNLVYDNYSAKILSVTQGPPDDIPNDEDDNGKPPVNITPPNTKPRNDFEMDVENGYVNYSFEGDTFILFRMTDLEDGEENEMNENINKGISKGEIGGELTIDSEKGENKQVSVNYADMNMMTQVKDKNRVRVMVSSDTLGENGKIVVAEIYKNVLDVDDIDDLEIKFDGEKISMADDYSDLNDTSDGAEYLVSIGQDKIQVLVMVPHFSTHSIDIIKTIENAPELIGNFSYYIPAVVITALIIASTVWISKKR